MLQTTFLAIPFFAFFIGLEALYDWYRGSREYNVKDAWTNIFVGFMSLVWGALFGALAGAIYLWCYEIAPYKFPANAWWTWVLLFFLDDFAYYWFHRASHEIRVFWNFHVVHHSSNYYNLSVAVRQSWFGGAVSWLFYFPLMLLGFAPWMFFVMHGLNLLYQFYIHTRFVKRLGFLESFMNTPSHHRVHHGANDVYLDKNYAGVLIVWDKMFGTFVEEKEEPRYGTIKPLTSFNPLWINTHAWAETLTAVKQRKGFYSKIRCFFGSPNLDI
jgi:sterol desaturase/sphingolipid hydroxylase (fatty acid hydroxylase superfamily)